MRAEPLLIGALLALAPSAASAQGPMAHTSSAKVGKTTARPSCAGAQLKWRTRGEVDNLGWHVYRLKGGKRLKLTRRMLAGSALRARGRGQRRAGRSYAYLDRAGRRGHRYFLRDVALNGRKRWHGPYLVKGNAVRPVASTPVLGGRRRQAPRCAGTAPGPGGSGQPGPGGTGPLDVPPIDAEPGQPSGIAKVGVEADGWYRVPLTALAEAGVDTRQPTRLIVTTSGTQQAAVVRDGALEFHGRALDSPQTDRRIYLVSRGAVDGLRIVRAAPAEAADAPSSFSSEATRHKRSIYFGALRNGAASNFFGEVITAAGASPTVAVPDVATTDGAELDVSLVGVTTGAHAVTVELNGNSLGTIDFARQDETSRTFAATGLQSGANTVRVAATGGGDVSLLGALRISYRRELRARDDELAARVAGSRRVRIDGFTHRELRVMDVTDPGRPVELPVSTSADGTGYAATFTTPAGDTRRILAFGDDRARPPASIARDAASAWSAATNQADLLIITSAELRQDLQPLVDLRRAEGLRTEVALIADVFDEFGHSMPSDVAVRDFIAHARATWAVPPRYVLLAGDGTHDPRGFLGSGTSTDVLPVHLTDTDFMEAPSDNWFADADGDGTLDLSLGRLPVSTSGQAKAVVAKLVAYAGASPAPSAVFAADNAEAKFAAGNQELAELLPAGYARTFVVKGEPDARARSLEALGQGPSLVNYSGHGSVDFWSGDLLANGDAGGLPNSAHPSLYLMLTCLNGYFSDPVVPALAELLLIAPGGAISSWASSGKTIPEPQIAAEGALLRALYPERVPSGIRLGDAVRAGLDAAGDGDIRATFTLLGDPTVVIK